MAHPRKISAHENRDLPHYPPTIGEVVKPGGTGLIERKVPATKILTPPQPAWTKCVFFMRVQGAEWNCRARIQLAHRATDGYPSPRCCPHCTTPLYRFGGTIENHKFSKPSSFTKRRSRGPAALLSPNAHLICVTATTNSRFIKVDAAHQRFNQFPGSHQLPTNR